MAERLDSIKWAILGLICIVATIIVAALKPIPQSLAYHQQSNAVSFRTRVKRARVL